MMEMADISSSITYNKDFEKINDMKQKLLACVTLRGWLRGRLQRGYDDWLDSKGWLNLGGG